MIDHYEALLFELTSTHAQIDHLSLASSSSRSPSSPSNGAKRRRKRRGQAWGWLEAFVLIQVFWGVLLFFPGSQAYRAYIRAFPYVISLVALLGCIRSGSTDSLGPGARLVVVSLFMLVASLRASGSWLGSGMAQIVFQLSIAAPIFWAVACGRRESGSRGSSGWCSQRTSPARASGCCRSTTRRRFLHRS